MSPPPPLPLPPPPPPSSFPSLSLPLVSSSHSSSLVSHTLPPSPSSPYSSIYSWFPSRFFFANGRSRLWFRRSLRKFGLDPGTVAHRLQSYCKPLSASDKEELKKMTVPLSSLSSLLLIFIGPTLLPSFFLLFCLFFFSLILLVNYSHVIRFAIAFRKLRRVALDWERNPNPKVQFKHLHAIVIPNYQEPVSLLRSTLTQLAQHRSAKSHYVIVLAMEAAEGTEGEAKANRLTKDFTGAFHSIITTIHPTGIPGECRGKGANVAWAVHHTDTFVQQLPTVDAHRVILTIVDADAGLSELYFNELEREMVENPSHDAVPLVDPQYRVFCPPIFFARNSHHVPALVRATDVAWSIAFMQNLGSPNHIHFPCSSYSVTLSLARHVGGWDTSADAIGEDMHMFLKCFYFSHGLARATPIYVPVNLANVQASTYWGSVVAKFTQVRRHFAGSADSLYAIRHTFWPHAMDLPPPIPTRTQPSGHLVIPKVKSSKANLEAGQIMNESINYGAYLWARISCLSQVLEAHLVPSTSWITMLALPLTGFLNPSLAATWSFSSYLKVLSMIMVLPYIAMALMYEYSHRILVRTQLLGPQNQTKGTRSWIHILEYALLPISAIIYVALHATSHCDNALRILVLRKHAKEFTYVVAEKVLVDQFDPTPAPIVHMSVPLPTHMTMLLSTNSLTPISVVDGSCLSSDRTSAASSPALSEVDSGVDQNETINTYDIEGDDEQELASIIIENCLPLSLSLDPSTLFSLEKVSTYTPTDMPHLQLPPSLSNTMMITTSLEKTCSNLPLPPSPILSCSPPSPLLATSHTLQIIATQSWKAARLDTSPTKRPGHAKHLSTDSGFYEMDTTKVNDRNARWVGNVGNNNNFTKMNGSLSPPSLIRTIEPSSLSGVVETL